VSILKGGSFLRTDSGWAARPQYLSMEKALYKFIDSKRDWIISFTKSLVEIPTVNPPGNNYEKLVGRLEKELKSLLRLSVRKITVPQRLVIKKGIRGASKRVCLLGCWQTGSKKTVHLNGHYDVVPASSNWDTPPFQALLKGDRLYGRGSEDMKGTISSMVLGVWALKELGLQPEVNVEFSFTPDEEIGGETGFGWLVKKGIVKPDYGISEGYTDSYISCGNKGMIWAEFGICGLSAHGATPHMGINAFDGMIEMATELKSLNKRVSRRRTKWAMRNDKDRYATLVLGGEAGGGTKVNMVPDYASFSVDRRILPEENIRNVKSELEGVLNRMRRRRPDLKFSMKIKMSDGPVVIDKANKLPKAIGSAVKKVLGVRANYGVMPGGTDMRYLIKRGIPAVGYSARGGFRWHSDNEYISVRSMLNTAKIYALTILNL